MGSQVPISVPVLGSCSPKLSSVASHPQWNSLFTPFLPSLLPLPYLPPSHLQLSFVEKHSGSHRELPQPLQELGGLASRLANTLGV